MRVTCPAVDLGEEAPATGRTWVYVTKGTYTTVEEIAQRTPKYPTLGFRTHQRPAVFVHLSS